MIDAIIKGLALGFILSLSVGPVIFSIIKRSLTDGHKPAYYFVAGVSASDCTFVIIANIFTALFAKALQHQTFIAVAGSIFLLILGCYTAFFKKPAVDNNEDEPKFIKNASKKDLITSFISGYLMNLLNPGAFLFWFAWSAAILSSSLSEPDPLQYRTIVFGVCLLFVLSTDIAKVVLAGKLRSKLTPNNLHLLDRISGFILIIFGAALLYMYYFKTLFT